MVDLKTKRLTLRPMGPQYLHSAHAYASDIENTKFMLFLPNDTLEETVEFLAGAEEEWKKYLNTDTEPFPYGFEFAILLDDVHIGGTGITLQEDRSKAEIGWILHKDYWGHGYTTEAAKAVMEFGIQELGVNHFIAHCDAENVASYKVMEKLGMHRTSRTNGRKNKSSDEEREELQYEMLI